MKAWAGLGYYARARNLHACAEAVVRDHGGRFPDTAAGLKALPGIGDYTAAAIAAIAFDEPVAVVDGNIERVIARLFAIDTPMPAAKKDIRARQQAMTPRERAGDYAQAMMDLGAAICTPKRPACALCPLDRALRGAARGEEEALSGQGGEERAPDALRRRLRRRPRRRRGAAAPAAGQGPARRHDRGARQRMGESRQGLGPAADAPIQADWRRLPARSSTCSPISGWN